MKVFIQSNRTKEFYAGNGHWQPTRERAMEFGTSLHAERIAAEEKLESVSLVLTFETGRSTVIVPLNLSFVEDDGTRGKRNTPPQS